MDPEVHLGTFAQGVKVGPGTRMPRLRALYKRKRRGRLPEQRDPLSYLEDERQSEKTWRQNYATVAGLADKVVAVLEDQESRGQVLKFTEAEAVAKYPDLVIASLGAMRKDKPNGVVTARVLHEGTNGLAVNTRTRIRDQERSPIASDLKRAMREKADHQQPTLAHTADVSEAHRQVPVHPSDWKFLGCRVEKGAFGVCEHSRDLWHQVGFILLEQSCSRHWPSHAVFGWSCTLRVHWSTRGLFWDLFTGSCLFTRETRSSQNLGYVAFFLQHLSRQLQNSRHYDCAAKLYPSQLSHPGRCASQLRSNWDRWMVPSTWSPLVRSTHTPPSGSPWK